MYQLRVGAAQIHDIIDIDDDEWPRSLVLPDSSPDQISACPDVTREAYRQETDGLRLKFGGNLLVINGWSVIIDCGVGIAKDRAFHRPWDMRTDQRFLADLAAAGYEPHEIDFVLITHGHVDHLGWLTIRDEDDGWQPTFPQATHVFARVELEHWLEQFERDPQVCRGAIGDSVLPLLDKVKMRLVDDGAEIVPGVVVEVHRGHTPGHLVVWVSSNGEDAAFSGDMLHHPGQLAHPEWSSGFCADQQQSAAARKRFLNEVVERQAILVPAHFRSIPRRLEQMGAGFQFHS